MKNIGSVFNFKIKNVETDNSKLWLNRRVKVVFQLEGSLLNFASNIKRIYAN